MGFLISLSIWERIISGQYAFKTMFFIIIAFLLCISFIWSLWSLRGLKKDKKVVGAVTNELKTGRVIFHKDTVGKHHSSSASVSSEEEVLVER